LDTSAEILQKYQPITSKDLTVNKDVTEENRLGQSSDVLAWFWRIEGVELGTSQLWTEECECMVPWAVFGPDSVHPKFIGSAG
jgi:hypothetical protein